jgi:hypothetical protein
MNAKVMNEATREANEKEQKRLDDALVEKMAKALNLATRAVGLADMQGLRNEPTARAIIAVKIFDEMLKPVGSVRITEL